MCQSEPNSGPQGKSRNPWKAPHYQGLNRHKNEKFAEKARPEGAQKKHKKNP